MGATPMPSLGCSRMAALPMSRQPGKPPRSGAPARPLRQRIRARHATAPDSNRLRQQLVYQKIRFCKGQNFVPPKANSANSASYPLEIAKIQVILTNVYNYKDEVLFVRAIA
jgi:hypothetical protein